MLILVETSHSFFLDIDKKGKISQLRLTGLLKDLFQNVSVAVTVSVQTVEKLIVVIGSKTPTLENLGLIVEVYSPVVCGSLPAITGLVQEIKIIYFYPALNFQQHL